MASVVVTGASVSSVWTGRDRTSRKPRASTSRRRRGWTRAALAGGVEEVALAAPTAAAAGRALGVVAVGVGAYLRVRKFRKGASDDGGGRDRENRTAMTRGTGTSAVSYTHLTLPTKRIV